MPSGPNTAVRTKRHETPHYIRGHPRGRRARAGVAGCSAGSSSSSSSGSTSTNTSTSSTLTISNENGALWTCGFNPLNPSDNLLSVGFIYEPLVYVNPLQGGKTTPMLASSYAWGAGNKSLTFTIRQGVKWSDGTPMTAADVAYTFNLIKKYPALDLTGVWSVPVQRHRDRQHGHHGLQHRRRAVLLLHRGPDADRAGAHLVDATPTRRPTPSPARWVRVRSR